MPILTFSIPVVTEYFYIAVLILLLKLFSHHWSGVKCLAQGLITGDLVTSNLFRAKDPLIYIYSAADPHLKMFCAREPQKRGFVSKLSRFFKNSSQRGTK